MRGPSPATPEQARRRGPHAHREIPTDASTTISFANCKNLECYFRYDGLYVLLSRRFHLKYLVLLDARIP